MITAHVTFTKDLSISVKAESKEELEKALKSLVSSGKIDEDWYINDWDYHIYIPKEEIGKCDHGVLDNEVVNIQDYNEAKGVK